MSYEAEERLKQLPMPVTRLKTIEVQRSSAEHGGAAQPQTCLGKRLAVACWRPHHASNDPFLSKSDSREVVCPSTLPRAASVSSFTEPSMEYGKALLAGNHLSDIHRVGQPLSTPAIHSPACTSYNYYIILDQAISYLCLVSLTTRLTKHNQCPHACERCVRQFCHHKQERWPTRTSYRVAINVSTGCHCEEIEESLLITGQYAPLDSLVTHLAKHSYYQISALAST